MGQHDGTSTVTVPASPASLLVPPPSVWSSGDMDAPMMEMPLMEMPRWKGRAYRGGPSMIHDRSATAADVVRYEQDVLGNPLGISASVVAALERVPAWHVRWVTRTRRDARRYGPTYEVEMSEDARILASDGEGGYLVFDPMLTRM